MKVILICFCYQYDSKYRFSPKYLRADLSRLIVYVMNTYNLNMKDIEILTDLEPISKIKDEIIEEYDKKSKDGETIPLISEYNSVEMANIFAHFHSIRTVEKFIDILKKVVMDANEVFLYYTGHCLHNASILIPLKNEVMALSKDIFHGIIKKIPSGVLIFDCCYAETLLFDNIKISMIGSCKSDQLCRFYRSPDKYGSLFTYYLITYPGLSLNSIDSKIYKYSIENKKEIQNLVAKNIDRIEKPQYNNVKEIK